MPRKFAGLLSFFMLACVNPRMGTGDVEGSVRGGASDLKEGSVGLPEKTPEMSVKKLDDIAVEACKMAGGECLSGSAMSEENVLVAGINCRSSLPGVFCIRKGGICEGHDEQRCCKRDPLTGKSVVHGRVGCDRGYPVCLNVGDWRAKDARSCTTPLPPAAPEDAPSRWPDAADVQSAARWACEQVGGSQIEREEYAEAVQRNAFEELCSDGYTVNFADFALCCVRRTLVRPRR
jgi:hypothetical protein